MPGLLAELPALPLHEAGKYVAGAYVVLFALVLVYVAIMAIRQSRLERDLGELLQREQDAQGDRARPGDATQTGSAGGVQAGGASADPSQRESTLV
jgi:hypothetical protein